MSNCVLGLKLLTLQKLERLIYLQNGNDKKTLYQAIRVLGEQIAPLLETAQEDCINKDQKCANCPFRND
jgi:hypothetical protein